MLKRIIDLYEKYIVNNVEDSPTGKDYFNYVENVEILNTLPNQFNTPYSQWVENWLQMLYKITSFGGRTTKIEIEQPVSQENIHELEIYLGMRLPNQLHTFLSDFSSNLNFHWLHPSICEDLKIFEDGYPFEGAVSIGVSNLMALEDIRQDNFKYHPDNNLWIDKLLFMGVPGDDYLALELSDANHQKVIYLRHDWDDNTEVESHNLNGQVIANSLYDFFDEWSRLGCPGPHEYQITPFLNPQTGYLDSECTNAILWRERLEI